VVRNLQPCKKVLDFVILEVLTALSINIMQKVDWFLDFVRDLVFRREQNFRKWICSHPRVKMWEGTCPEGPATKEVPTSLFVF
jgi:hypothetical protein